VMRARGVAVAVLGLATTLGACRDGRGPASPPGVAPATRAISTPSPDREGLCADVGTTRVCWDARGAPALVERTLPRVAATTPMGWRCAWPGPVRHCVDRAAVAPAFTCDGPRCTQRHARLPDDGEWTCVDSAGAVVCVGGAAPAGVVAGPPEVGWICGERRGAPARDEGGARVCVDFSPDFPDGQAAAWRCRIENGASPVRVCERAASLELARRGPALGDACDRSRPCVDGATCVSARCVPARPAPTCTLDADCSTGACRFGTCRAEAAP
jgi:hypothetical protein